MKECFISEKDDANRMEDNTRMINRLTAVGILGNLFLSAFKFVAGILGNSSAMISDAIHSLSDIGATIIAYFGAKLGQKETDHNHPYGHERLECVSSTILGVILFLTGALIGIEGIKRVVSGDYGETPETIALVAAMVSIVVKELMFQYTMHHATIMQSDSFKADAWHHRSDAISSVAALIGIGLAMMGFPIMDPIASVIISLFIIKMSYDITKDAFDKMVDTACEDCIVEDIRKVIEETEGVRSVDCINTRKFGNKIYVDVEISVECDLTVEEGHEIAENVHLRVEHEIPAVKHVMVHVNPFNIHNKEHYH